MAGNTDLIGVVLAIIGLLVTAYTVVVARRSQRRDAFMRIHETLLQPEIQDGRRLLFEVTTADAIPKRDTLDYQRINRALAFYDTLGHYIRRGHIDQREALDIWHHPLQDIREPAELFIRARTESHRSPWTPWPHLRWLLTEAKSYRSKDDCCTAPDPGRATRGATSNGAATPD